MPKFYMLIGLPGAGKTEIAKDFADSHSVLLSSDALRKELYGDENIQDNPAMIFETMRQRAINALKSGKNVIYDATNLRRKKRKHLLSSLNVPCEKIACVVWAKFETCIKRDSQRIRHVGAGVIRNMLLDFQPPYYDEGWDEIQFMLNDTPYSLADYNNWVDCEHHNPHHNNTVKEHTNQVVDKIPMPHVTRGQMKCSIATQRCTLALLMAAQLHDIGKKFTKSFYNSRGEYSDVAHYYNHQNVGSYFAIGHVSTINLPTVQRALIYWLINVHMDPFLNTKYSRSLPENLKTLLDALHSADVAGA